MAKYSILGLVTCALLCGSAFADELAGEWILTIETPRGIQHPTLVVEHIGGTYSGVYNSLRGAIPIESISHDGNSFSFPLVITVPIGEIEVIYRGTYSADSMTGSVRNPRGEVPFTGERSVVGSE